MLYEICYKIAKLEFFFPIFFFKLSLLELKQLKYKWISRNLIV